VTQDIEATRFNTAVASMMSFVNAVNKEEAITDSSLRIFLRLLCPFAPHVANEIYQSLGGEGFLESHEWPEYDPELIKESQVEIAVQVNGKLRAMIKVAADQASDQKIVEDLAKKATKVVRYLEGKKIKKVIFIPNKLINFVV